MKNPTLLLLSAILTFVCGIFGCLFLRTRRRGYHRLALALKGLAGLCFCAIGVLFYPDASDAGKLIVYGLAAGLIGDELLGLRKIWPQHHNLCFLAGAVAFAGGHVLYIAAMLQMKSGLFLPALPLFFLFLAGSYFYSRVRKHGSSSMSLPGFFYISLVAYMSATGISLAFRLPQTGTLLLAFGSISFLISDNLLSAYTFGNRKTRLMDQALHITYYLAQLLIAWSVAFL